MFWLIFVYNVSENSINCLLLNNLRFEIKIKRKKTTVDGYFRREGMDKKSKRIYKSIYITCIYMYMYVTFILFYAADWKTITNILFFLKPVSVCLISLNFVPHVNFHHNFVTVSCKHFTSKAVLN